jgi:LmbE family N-acetylglucosaminyl deacetylase
MGAGAVVAKYVAEGVDVYLVCATRGERGWQGDEKDNPGFAGLGKIRTNELMKAAKVLGLREVNFLDFMDGELDRVNPAEAVNKIATHIRRIQPQVIVTFGPDGAYGHPDHIAISQLTSAAIVCAADSGYADSLNQPSHRVAKLYYQEDPKSFVEMLHSWGFDLTFDVDGVTRQHLGWDEWMITTRLDVGEYWRTAREAVLCHASQIVSWKHLLDAMTDDMHRLTWSQSTFYRAYSSVNGGRKVETDLFEGLR